MIQAILVKQHEDYVYDRYGDIMDYIQTTEKVPGILEFKTRDEFTEANQIFLEHSRASGDKFQLLEIITPQDANELLKDVKKMQALAEKKRKREAKKNAEKAEKARKTRSQNLAKKYKIPVEVAEELGTRKINKMAKLAKELDLPLAKLLEEGKV